MPPSPPPRAATSHFFTVDVEEHFQVSAFERAVPRSAWQGQESRVARNTELLLELLARYETAATFFVLGWVAERYPALVRRIAAAGHEVASHGWWHLRVNTIDRETFRDEVRRSKGLLESLTGEPVDGFRAPSFSITPGTEWAFDVLLEEGYRYDSSIFPVRRPGYGYPGAPRRHYSIQRESGSLLELPMTTLGLGPLRLPAAGGGYLRQLPLALLRAAFRQADRERLPGMFYVHPWEIDPDQPRYPVGPITALRHYRGLEKTLPSLHLLLGEFSFTSVRAWRSGAR
jgi:polysaccharide deacetylase family protein (PEP-CTERM system associated)